jgi:hypothetical protein
MLGVVVVGGIYSPNHQTNRWGGCLSMGDVLKTWMLGVVVVGGYL